MKKDTLRQCVVDALRGVVIVAAVCVFGVVGALEHGTIMLSDAVVRIAGELALAVLCGTIADHIDF